jgi:hypothetical protein
LLSRGRKTEAPVEDQAPRALRGVRMDLAEQGMRLTQLTPLIRGFQAPEGFHLWNGEYESIDAEVLWAMVKGLQPKRVTVLGANTHVRTLLRAMLPKETDLKAKPEDLAARDILVAGVPDADLVLSVLPDLSPGVVVHVEGIRLPWRNGHSQDLLQAFLTGNRHYEILLALHALAREQPDVVRKAVPSWRGTSQPRSMWLRRT